MKNLILNHEYLIDAVSVYEDNSDYTTVDFEKLIEPTVKIEGKAIHYTGQIRMDIADEAIVFIYFKMDKKVSFLVQGRDPALGATVVNTLINNAKRG